MSRSDAPRRSDAETRFLELWADVEDLGTAAELLGWDQETYMPPKGQEARGRLLATLAGLRHARLTAPELGDALEAFAAEAEPGTAAEAQVREARRLVARATRVPGALERRLAEAKSAGLAAWQEARRRSDFALFRARLEELVALTREAAEHLAPLAPTGRPYDALLDEYEPGTTEEELAPLLSSLRDDLAPLVRAVAESGRAVDESPAKGAFPHERQLAFGRRCAEAMGFDFDAGRLDPAPHPFCSGFGPGDVRLTWRWQEDDFRPALFGILHEAGHGLYEQGLPPEHARTPIGHAVSLGVHESQSRLWENLVGRSRAFWEWALPAFVEAFPEKRGTTVDALVPALHTVRPTPIRVEADEATYNLHVIARFELERALFAGDLEVGDLPGAWDDRYEDLLGIRPASQAEGVLQDIHWAMGAFGYFPTYTLGNLVASQLFSAARSDLGDLDDQVRRGELRPLLEWLREKVHRHGSRYPAPELVERATGRPLAADDLLAHLRASAEETYGVSVPA